RRRGSRRYHTRALLVEVRIRLAAAVLVTLPLRMVGLGLVRTRLVAPALGHRRVAPAASPGQDREERLGVARPYRLLGLHLVEPARLAPEPVRPDRHCLELERRLPLIHAIDEHLRVARRRIDLETR